MKKRKYRKKNRYCPVFEIGCNVILSKKVNKFELILDLLSLHTMNFNC